MLKWLPSMIWRPLESRDSLPLADGEELHVADSLRIPPQYDEVLGKLLWKAQGFDAVCTHDSQAADLTIRFPSPLPLGNAAWDEVVMDWHVAREHGQFIHGPAVLVIDILQGGQLVANYIAKTLAKNGIHGFVLHMPQNGRRRGNEKVQDWSQFLPTLRQAVGDARRARDVMAALPLVDGTIGIQGTSLGGFVATLAASIDDAFDPVLLALTGGDLFGVLNEGKRDAARVRRQLRNAGYDDEKLRDWLWQIEPLRVAHRLDPRRTWLFSARYDQVVPRDYARKLATAIGLEFSHRRELTGCHYSCVLSARRFLSEMVTTVTRRAAGGVHASTV